MSYSQIENMFGKYTQYEIHDAIIHSKLSNYEKGKLIGKLVATSFPTKPSGFKSRI